MARVIVKPIEPALISSSVMVLDEISAEKVKYLMDAVFEQVEKIWIEGSHKEGSHHQRWYRSVATGPNAVKKSKDMEEEDNNNVVQGRLIAWKTNEPFLPNNLFFRTIDTSRLLPMHLADFRVQMYAHPTDWDHLDNLKDWTRTKWKQYILQEMMHDCGGGDIPIIITRWTAEFTAKALETTGSN